MSGLKRAADDSFDNIMAIKHICSQPPPDEEGLGQGHSLLDMFDSNRHPIFFDGLCEYLHLQDLLKLSMVCRRLHQQTKQLLQFKWGINARLADFVDCPRYFRYLYGKAKAVIAGSFVLQHFLKERWPESSLDLFIPLSRLEEIVPYLVESEQYSLESLVALDEEESGGIHEVSSNNDRPPIFTMHADRADPYLPKKSWQPSYHEDPVICHDRGAGANHLR